jgi:acetolactate synthase-1/2/3 large subunit
LGHIGYFPGPDVATGIAAADLIIAINTELGDVDTQNYKLPAPGAGTRGLIHVHPDGDVLGRLYATDLAVAVSGTAFLAQMNAFPTSDTQGRDDSWLATIAEARQRARTAPLAESPFSAVVQAIGEATPAASVITIDAGNFSTWVHRLLGFGSGRRMLAAACGAMGLAVPSALAAACACRAHLSLRLSVTVVPHDRQRVGDCGSRESKRENRRG